MSPAVQFIRLFVTCCSVHPPLSSAALLICLFVTCCSVHPPLCHLLFCSPTSVICCSVNLPLCHLLFCSSTSVLPAVLFIHLCVTCCSVHLCVTCCSVHLCVTCCSVHPPLCHLLFRSSTSVSPAVLFIHPLLFCLSPAKPTTTAVTSTKTEEQPAAEVQGTMDIELDMQKPEIILIEDQMNLDTNALVVDVSCVCGGVWGWGGGRRGNQCFTDIVVDAQNPQITHTPL